MMGVMRAPRVGNGAEINLSPRARRRKREATLLNVEQYISRHDFVGAVTVLKFLTPTIDNLRWLGYSYFHMREYAQALDMYFLGCICCFTLSFFFCQISANDRIW